MQEEDVAKGTLTDVSAKPRTVWRRLIGKGGLPGPPIAVKIVVGVVVVAVLMAVVVALYANVPAEESPGAAIDFPKEWTFGWEVIKFIDGVVDWVVIKWDPFFSAINIAVLRGILVPLEKFLLWLPWWLVIIVVGLLGWRVVTPSLPG